MKRWIGALVAGLVTTGLAYGALSSSGWAAFWFALLAVGGVAETIALGRMAKNDTFSEIVWDTTDKTWAKALLAAFMAWLSYHFLLQGPKDKSS